MEILVFFDIVTAKDHGQFSHDFAYFQTNFLGKVRRLHNKSYIFIEDIYSVDKTCISFFNYNQSCHHNDIVKRQHPSEICQNKGE